MIVDRCGGFLDRLQATNVPGRMLLFFLTAHTGWLAGVDVSLIGKIFDGVEVIGVVAICIAVVGMVDTFINDVLPPKYHFAWALSTRHFTLMLCAGFFAVGAWLCLRPGDGIQMIPYFVVCCGTICLHAFLDLRRRFKWR